MRCGGGVNHRATLSDQALVKDNHVLAAGGVVPAYDAVRARYPGLPVQVEVTTLDQLRELLDAGAPDDPARQHEHRRRWPRRCGSPTAAPALEASGGLTLERAREVAATGVDFIAVGALTHSAPVLDIAMDLPAMTPLLCADIGNSHTDDRAARRRRRRRPLAGGHRRAAHRRRVGRAAQAACSRLHRSASALRGVAVCATVPAVLHEWRDMLRTYHGDVPQVIVEPGVRTGVPVLMDNPREVGTDRIVNALAASQLFDGPAIVVDFGTATTFDVVSAQGEYVGGAIAPGIDISLEALGRRGAQLRKVELLRPRSVIAKNTVEALQSRRSSTASPARSTASSAG